MITLVMRHLESKKNIAGTFSSRDDKEKLTQTGELLGQKVAKDIRAFVKNNGLVVHHVYCANSARAISTANFIADELSVDVRSFNELRSNNSGALLGKSEEEAESINPLFIKQLKLFRAGLFSSYNFVKVTSREDKRAFEQRVIGCISFIMSDTTEDLKIIILHHSSLTATMIHVARKLCGYPKDFYGHISCELGNIFLWNANEIFLCNESTSKLEGISMMKESI